MDFSKDNVVPRVGRMEQLAAIKRYAIEPGQTVETHIRLQVL